MTGIAYSQLRCSMDFSDEARRESGNATLSAADLTIDERVRLKHQKVFLVYLFIAHDLSEAELNKRFFILKTGER